MTTRRLGIRILAMGCAGLGCVSLALSGCSSSGGSSTGTNGGATNGGATNGGGAPAVATRSSGASAAGPTTADAGTVLAGQPDLGAICPKLPVADAQPLVRPTLSAAVEDDRLGGCSFLMPGESISGSNLTVALAAGDNAAQRYAEDTNGTFSAGGSTVSTGTGISTPLSGVGDKAVWGTTVGYPTVSALKGSVYCSVLIPDDATQLTIIGTPGNPLPQGTKDQQLQYAQLEGKLCTDLFGLVH